MQHELELTGVDVDTVLLPDQDGNPSEGVRITVHGPQFPQRALVPELWIGERRAEQVSISRDGRSLSGYLRELPPDRATVSVRYGASLAGSLELGFRRDKIRPLPGEC